jgi:hypothetical protein
MFPIPTLRTHPAALLAILALAACGPRAAPPAPTPPATVRIAPATARFRLVEHRHVEQGYHGQMIVTDAVTRARFTVAIDSTPTGFALDAAVDSVDVSGDAGVSPEAVASAAGARFQADVARNGAVREVTGPGDDNPLLDQLGLRMHELLPRMPTDGAAPGATWMDTTHASGRTAGIPITIEARGRHHGAAAWIEFDGRQVLPLTSETLYTLSGEGERAGQWITMAGTGTSHVRRFVTPDGVVALGVRQDTLRLAIELPGTGLRIPLTQVRTDTLRRVD